MAESVETATAQPNVQARWKAWLSSLSVLAAMALVAFAIGVGLVHQFGLAVWLATVVAILSGASAMLAHLAVLRGRRIGALEAQNTNLKETMGRLTAPVARYQRSGAAMPPTPKEAAEAAAAAAPVEARDAAGQIASNTPPGRRGLGSLNSSITRDIVAVQPAAPKGIETAVTAEAIAAAVSPLRTASETAGQAASAARSEIASHFQIQDMVPAASQPKAQARPNAGGEPVAETVPSASDTGEPNGGPTARAADAAAIQGFVEKLAREPRAADASAFTEPLGRSAGTGPTDAAPMESLAATADPEAAISQSVRALKTAAASMRDDGPAGEQPDRSASRHDPDLAAFQQDAEDDDDIDDARPDAAASLSQLLDPRIALLIEALDADRIDIFLEPIVALAEKSPRHFEVSARFRDPGDAAIDPHDDPADLRGSGVLPLVDLAKISRVADLARRLAERGKTGAVFTSLAAETFEDEEFLNRFAEIYIDRTGFAEQLVVSLAQAEARMLSGAQLEMIEDMRELGFRFALDHVTSLDMDLEALRAAGVSFIKLDAAVFLEGLPAGDEISIPAEDICRHLSDLGFEVVVEGIAETEVLDRLVACGVPLGRGELFGGARPVKAEVFNPRQASAA